MRLRSDVRATYVLQCFVDADDSDDSDDTLASARPPYFLQLKLKVGDSADSARDMCCYVAEWVALLAGAMFCHVS